MMSSARPPAPRLVIWGKRVLYLVLAIIGLGVAAELNLSRLQTVALAGLPILALEGLLHSLVGPRLRLFDQLLMKGVQGQDPASLWPLYQKEWLLRFAAPKHEMLAKLGLIYQRNGMHDAAAFVYREAVDEAPARQQGMLVSRLADALLASSAWDEAARAYRRLVDDSTHGPRARLTLSRLIREHRLGELEEALALLRPSVDAAPEANESPSQRQARGQARLELAEVLAALGRQGEADLERELAQAELAEPTAPPTSSEVA